jgi:hypothetical protein
MPLPEKTIETGICLLIFKSAILVDGCVICSFTSLSFLTDTTMEIKKDGLLLQIEPRRPLLY